MVAITATEFAKSFGRYKEEAQREPVAITSYGCISGYFVKFVATGDIFGGPNLGAVIVKMIG